MSAKFKKSNATIKSGTSENTLQKRLPTASKEFRGITNEGEFSYNFRKFCIECRTTIIPNIKLVAADDLRESSISCSTISKTSHSQASSVNRPRCKDSLAVIPEILAVQDETTNAIVELIFRHFRVEKNMLIALTKTFKTGICLRALKLDFCQLTCKEINALAVILRMVDTITEVSANGNPNKTQNFDLLLEETKLHSLSLRFCGINAEGAKNIAQRLHSFSTEIFLTQLNLSSNFLGDEGAAEIAKSLRVNRTLLILNLADNQITDKGCEKIAETLQSFPLTAAEIKMRRARIFEFYKRKQDVLEMMTMTKSKITVQTGSATSNKRSRESVRRSKDQELKKERSSLKPASSTTSSKTAGSGRSKIRSETDKMSAIIGENILPPDLHPFVKDAEINNREWYCVGNNKLISLNLAYNKITQVGMSMLSQMLLYQKNKFLLPDVGILRMCVEGNCAPNCCSEMNEILEVITSKNETLHGSVSARKLSAVSQQ